MTQPASNGPPGVDLRVVLITIHDGCLLVALTPGEVGLRLPRGLPAVAETLDGAARQIVRTATGVRERYLEQLYTLSVRNPAPWTVVVSYVALVSTDAGSSPSGAIDLWHPIEDLPSLSETDRMVVDYALFRLRAKLGYTNPPARPISRRRGQTERNACAFLGKVENSVPRALRHRWTEHLNRKGNDADRTGCGPW
jgi:ADP-ribose pyrophosphatase YjhB (NUDIX family)